MKKILPFIFLILFAFVLSACLPQKAEKTLDLSLIAQECSGLCSQITGICPDLIALESCNDKCLDCPENIREDIKASLDCREIAELLAQCFKPGTSPLDIKPADNACSDACNNYVNQCLTLVPNADQDLFQEGYDSCMDFCQDWDKDKIQCMADANDCPSMTYVCGL